MKRTGKLAVDLSTVSVDEHGNVVIRDRQLAEELRKAQKRGPVAADDNVCCSGCGC